MAKKKFNGIASLFKFRKNQDDLLDIVNDKEAVISPTKQIVENFMSNKMGMIGLIGFIVLLSVVLIGASINPNYNAYAHETTLQNLGPSRNYLKVPSSLKGKEVVDIQSGISFSLALDGEGKIHFWGKNPPQANVGDIISKVGDKKVTKIAVGDKHIIVLTSNGEIIGSGLNNFKQAELDSMAQMSLIGKQIVDIKAGVSFSAAVTSDGNVIAWGSTLPNDLDRVPERLKGRVKDIEIGTFNILTIMDDGTVDFFGKVGTPTSSIPAEFQDGSIKIVDLAIATNTVAALDDQGNVYTWGDKGNNLQTIPSFGEKVTSIQASRVNFIAQTESGKVITWGNAKFGLDKVPSKVTGSQKIFADFFQAYSVDADNKVTSWGNQGFLLGTDDLGRDLGERLLHGGRITLLVGAIAVIISTVIGVTVGLIAGFYGKWVDNLLMRFAEIISSFPFLPLAITLSAILPSEVTETQRMVMIMVILGVISWPGIARLVRGQILAEREKEFVTAARALGLKERTIIFKHILPSVYGIIIASMTLSYASSLLTEAGLSFLGFGIKPPAPSWGNMLNGISGTTVIEFYWWRWLLPALSVLIAALCVNLVGDALRDAIDPKSNRR